MDGEVIVLYGLGEEARGGAYDGADAMAVREGLGNEVLEGAGGGVEEGDRVGRHGQGVSRK